MLNEFTSEERDQFNAMMEQWGRYLSRNQMLSERYNGTTPVDDLGISIPPAMKNKLGRCSLMWSKQAVDRLVDGSIIDRFTFGDGYDGPAGFFDMLERNEIKDQYDEVKPLWAAHGCTFWTVTGGGNGEPPALISAYDALHATAILNRRTREALCGFAVVDTDIHDKTIVTAANFYASDGTIVEAEKVNGKWLTRRLNNNIGRCAMEVMRNNPDNADHAFGRSVITPAIKSLEDEANREVVRSAMTSELFTAPTRWIMGVDGDIFNGGHWNAYLGSIFALEAEDPENPPTTGQYPQADMVPHTTYIRSLAQMFAAEASIPVSELVSTDANPTSAEAMEASRRALVEKIEKVNRLNGRTLRNVGLMALSIMEQTPIQELSAEDRSLSVKWKNPMYTSVAASADAAQKLAAAVPGFAGTPTFWEMQGYDETEIAVILAEVEKNNEKSPAGTDGEPF